jgi:hypothetical protein
MATSVTVSPQIVRAWFDTVLNPLILALTTEATVLERGNLTWKTEVQRLASLVPVREHLVEEVYPNLDQILSLHPEFNVPIGEHDRRLPPLAQACGRLQEALLESKFLRQALDRVILERPPDKSSAQFLGGFERGDHLTVITECIINSVGKLPGYYETAPIWNKHRDEFVAVLKTVEVSPLWQATTEARGAFETAVRDLIDKLKAFRNELSLSTGVPMVDRLTGPI